MEIKLTLNGKTVTDRIDPAAFRRIDPRHPPIPTLLKDRLQHRENGPLPVGRYFDFFLIHTHSFHLFLYAHVSTTSYIGNLSAAHR